jgi:hypothetical protein
MFQQPEVQIRVADPYLYMRAENTWDVLHFKYVTIQFKISAVTLDATKWVKIHAQTNATLANEDWETITSATFTQGTQTAPYITSALLAVTSGVPLSRNLRWKIEFQTATPGQYVTFGVVGVARS